MSKNKYNHEVVIACLLVEHQIKINIFNGDKHKKMKEFVHLHV